MIIPEIDRLIEADKENVPLTKRLLYDFSPTLPDAINTASIHYKTISRIFSQNQKMLYPDLSHLCREANISSLSEFNVKTDKQITNKNKQFLAAKKAHDEIISRENRGALLVRLGILYATAAADILRMRLTGPQFYMRLQCETIGLIKLMHDNSEVASEWRDIKSEKDGIKFYRNYQAKLKSILKLFSLDKEYDSASATSLHSRFIGLAFGLRVSSSIEDRKFIQDIRVTVQELNPEAPHLFLIFVLQLLRVQQRIFSNLPKVIPEIKDELFIQTHVPNYERTIDELFKLYQKKYPIKPNTNI